MAESSVTNETEVGTVEVIRNYLRSAGTEMARTLQRTSYNSVVYEALDYGISLYDHDLNLISDSPGMTSFIGSNDYAIEMGIKHVGEKNFKPGDVVIMNYPYWNSAHTLDVGLFAPTFYDDDLVGYAMIRAHWLDLGQKDTGYVHDSTSIHQEGLLFPGTKVYKGGKPNEELLDVIRYNSRLPKKVIGDLNAQIASIEVGKRRLRELYDRYGMETIESSINQILDHGKRRAREGVTDLPDGTWSAVDYVDNDGVNDELVRMEAKVTIDGDNFIIDMSGSSDQVDGPINVPIGSTQTMGKVCLKTMTTPDESSNGGHYEPLQTIAPEGNLFHATYPAPTFTLWASILGIDLIFQALAKGMPDRVPASTGGDVDSIMFAGEHPDTSQAFVEGENAGVGWGGTCEHDGENALMHIAQTLVKGLPVEIIEKKAPVRLETLRLRQDSGGAGEHRGGLGIRKDYRILNPVTALSNIKKTRTENWGLEGGDPGIRNAVVLSNLDEDWMDRIDLRIDNDDIYESDDPSKKWTGMFYGDFVPGELISNRSAGGGGYGDPFERDPEAVQDDVIDGYVSSSAAREAYGVVVTAAGELDREETEWLRSDT